MTVRPERLSIEGPAGALEMVAEDPGGSATDYGLICHPHPSYGGTMDNKVVTTIARALHDSGIPTLKFNFRGVGGSAGAFDQGDGETADADAAAAWADNHWPGRSLILAGFSFGGYVALRLAQRREPRLLITVAPAVQRFDPAEVAVPRCPWLVIQGDADEVVDAKAVASWVDRLEPRPRLLLLPGVGHFFHGRLAELRDAVRDAVRSG